MHTARSAIGFTFAAAIVATLTGCTISDADRRPERTSTSSTTGTQVSITDDRHTIVATLNTSETARDFESLLPVTIDIETYSDSAKIGYPDRKLTTAGAPDGFDASTRDFVYYAPYGDIAMFYDDSPRYDEGLIPIGRITEGLNDLDDLGGAVRFAVVAGS